MADIINHIPLIVLIVDDVFWGRILYFNNCITYVGAESISALKLGGNGFRPYSKGILINETRKNNYH